MKPTQKAGCVVLDTTNKTIALVVRPQLGNDISFPKGHLEQGETIKECAIRETAEETKRDVKIVDDVPEYLEQYTTPKGEHCDNHMFLAIDIGKSDNDCWDTHPTIFVPIDEVNNKLSYNNQKDCMNFFRPYIDKILQK